MLSWQLLKVLPWVLAMQTMLNSGQQTRFLMQNAKFSMLQSLVLWVDDLV